MTIYHYLSPLVWDTSELGGFWRAPDGCRIGLDTRSLPDQALAGEYGDWPTAYILSETQQTGDDFTLLGTGRVDEVRPDGSAASAWESLLGVAPSGDTLLDWLIDLGTEKAVVDGSSPMKPYVPTREGDVELWLPLHSLVYRRRFGSWNPNGNRYHNRIRDLLRKDFKDIKKLGKEIAGKHLSVLSSKFGLLPSEIDADVKPLRPATTITESFNTGDSSTLGPNLSWSEYGVYTAAWNATDDWSVSSNYASCTQARIVGSLAVAGTALSGSDNYAEVTITAIGSASDNIQCGAIARVTVANATCYGTRILQYNDQITLFKLAYATFTQLQATAQAPATSKAVRCTTNGSTISDSYDGTGKNSQTDTSYSTGLSVGMWGYRDAGLTHGQDAFVGDDGIVAGHPAIKRFGGVPYAALNRGVW